MTVPPQLDIRFREAAAGAGLLDAAYDVADSPIGALLVAVTDRGLCRISFDADEGADRLSATFGRRVLRVPRRLDNVRRQLDEYFDGRREVFELEPDLRFVPDFHRRVLTELALVPYGQVTTYGVLAQKVGHPGSARAVGGAMNRNPIPIVLPCHRVIGANGNLTGYAGGIHVKRRLLELEHVTLGMN
jgi:methylated-DNA-[protein]-cysteine S-methyltransferase